MAEHLDAHTLSAWSAHILLFYLPGNLGHLCEIELTCQHHHIGKLCIEFQRLYITDVELGGEMHFLTDAAAVVHHGDITGDNGSDARLVCGIDDGVHGVDVLAVDDGVDGEVGLDAMSLALGGDMPEVVDGERVGGVGTHVELSDAEIHGVGTSLDSCR